MINFNWLIAGQSPDRDDNYKLVILLVDVHESIRFRVPDAGSGHRYAEIAFFEKSCIYHEFEVSLLFLNKLTDFVRNVICYFSAFLVIKLLQHSQLLLCHLLRIFLDRLMDWVLQCHIIIFIIFIPLKVKTIIKGLEFN